MGDPVAGGESKCVINENVRGKDVYIIWSQRQHPHRTLGEVCALAYTFKTIAGGAKNIYVVAPDIPFSRQDKSHGTREAIMAKFVANQLDNNFVNRLITMDLHSPQIEGFYKCTP